MAGKLENAQSGLTPLHLLLAAIGDECGELGRLVDDLQLSLSPAMAILLQNPACHFDLQALDMLSQCLAGLAGYAGALSRAAPEDIWLDSGPALACISVASLQQRLQGHQQSSAFSSGELDLF